MKHRKFGRTGISVSSLGLGTATFGKQADEAASVAILDKAAEAGVNFMDSSDFYPMSASSDEMGRSEAILGRWLKGKRGRFVIATKAGAPVGPSNWDQGASRKHLLDAIDGSLRRLGTDHVDLYSLHADDPATPLDESLEALDQIVRSGKARYVGVSNFLAYRLARAIGRQETLGLARFVCVQPRYNLLFREIERELLPLCGEEGVAVTPFNPLAGGLLTGKYRKGETPSEGRFSAANGAFGKIYQARYWQDREFAAIGRIEAIARQRGTAMPTLAVSWLTANSLVTSVILGASHPEQLDPTLASSDVELDAETLAALDEVTREFRRGDASR
jgi:1-deoxyxylulose-5-phosphate synthase